jgi:hypothetical protein
MLQALAGEPKTKEFTARFTTASLAFDRDK